MKRAVIVGCGNIAAVHAAVLTAQKDTELVGAQIFILRKHRTMPKDFIQSHMPH